MKKFNLHTLIFVLALFPLLGKAAPPTSYYQSINGLADENLKNALHTLIYTHSEVSSYSALPEYFKRTDAYYEGGRQYWWDMYSNIPVPTNITFGTYMNREHSFPKSWWGGGTNTPAYVDLYHLYPAEAKANMAKSNYPLGEVSYPTFDNDFVKVGNPVTGQGGGARLVFEPNDEYKGDFARTYMYVVTCYQNLTWAKNYDWMLIQGNYPTLKGWAIELLLKWSKEDPVSQKELDRNETVYSIQGNRNPFIDYPELAEYIWGDKVGNKFYVPDTGVTGDPTLITPENGMALDFSQTAVGNTVVENMHLKGENLTKTLTITLYGTDRTMFKIDTYSVSAALANSSGGTDVKVTYAPTSIGKHTAKIAISDGGLTGSVVIDLIGEALAVPTLNAVTATAATDINETSYTANWTDPNADTDYYIVTRTSYSNGSSVTEEILAESTSLEIEWLETSDSESYNVRAVKLGYQSPASNEIFVSRAGVADITNDLPLGSAYYPGGVRLVCGQPHTNVTVYDATGRIITVVPVVENNHIIQLPLGVYLITSDQQHKPLKVIVND